MFFSGSFLAGLLFEKYQIATSTNVTNTYMRHTDCVSLSLHPAVVGSAGTTHSCVAGLVCAACSHEVGGHLVSLSLDPPQPCSWHPCCTDICRHRIVHQDIELTFS